MKSFDEPACVIVKHANPCGVAVGANAARGLRKRLRAPTRPRPSAASSPSTARSTRATAEAVGKQFVEVVIAPRVEADALKVFATKANVRVLEVPLAHDAQAHDFKRVGGGLLVQTHATRSVSNEAT